MIFTDTNSHFTLKKETCLNEKFLHIILQQDKLNRTKFNLFSHGSFFQTKYYISTLSIKHACYLDDDF